MEDIETLYWNNVELYCLYDLVRNGGQTARRLRQQLADQEKRGRKHKQQQQQQQQQRQQQRLLPAADCRKQPSADAASAADQPSPSLMPQESSLCSPLTPSDLPSKNATMPWGRKLDAARLYSPTPLRGESRSAEY